MKKIKEIRELVGMKQGDLANALGIQQSNYSAMENERLIIPSAGTIKERALKILLPMLYEVIQKKEQELNDLKELYENTI